MKKKTILAIGIPLAVVLVLVLAGVLFVRGMQKSLDSMMQETVPVIDFSLLPDGTYEGTREAGPIKVLVSVQVSGGTLTAVDIVEHRNGQGGPGEAVVTSVLSSQSLQVDAVAGATYSSRCILLAIADAVENGD